MQPVFYGFFKLTQMKGVNTAIGSCGLLSAEVTNNRTQLECVFMIRKCYPMIAESGIDQTNTDQRINSRRPGTQGSGQIELAESQLQRLRVVARTEMGLDGNNHRAKLTFGPAVTFEQRHSGGSEPAG